MDLIQSLSELSVILGGLAVAALAVTRITKTNKDNEVVGRLINMVEKVIQKDLDKDGDIGQ